MSSPNRKFQSILYTVTELQSKKFVPNVLHLGNNEENKLVCSATLKINFRFFPKVYGSAVAGCGGYVVVGLVR